MNFNLNKLHNNVLYSDLKEMIIHIKNKSQEINQEVYKFKLSFIGVQWLLIYIHHEIYLIPDPYQQLNNHTELLLLKNDFGDNVKFMRMSLFDICKILRFYQPTVYTYFNKSPDDLCKVLITKNLYNKKDHDKINYDFIPTLLDLGYENELKMFKLINKNIAFKIEYNLIKYKLRKLFEKLNLMQRYTRDEHFEK